MKFAYLFIADTEVVSWNRWTLLSLDF